MLYTFIKKIKHYSAYILILFGMFYGIQTAPSGLYKILYQLNIKNRISLDLTDCSSFTFSIIKTDFFFPLFLLSLFSVLVGILLLCRKRVFIIQYNYYNLGVFCMEQNPCEPLYKEMQRYCNFALQQRPYRVYRGTPSTIWIARIMNIFGTTTKYKAQDFCNDSRESYKKCLEMFDYNKNIKFYV